MIAAKPAMTHKNVVQKGEGGGGGEPHKKKLIKNVLVLSVLTSQPKKVMNNFQLLKYNFV